MSTMERGLVDRLIAGGGWLPEHPDHNAPDNPRAVLIVEYTNAWGALTYGVTFAHESPLRRARYLLETDFIRSPRIFWDSADADRREKEPRCAFTGNAPTPGCDCLPCREAAQGRE